MRDPVYKKCRCRGEDGRDLGAACPKLKRSDDTWNPKHGTWYFTLDLPPRPGKERHRMRRGGYATREAAEAALREAKAKSEGGGDPSLRITLARYLEDWLELRVDLKPAVRRNYGFAIRTYLVPLLGHIELTRLRSADIGSAFATVRHWNQELAEGRPVRKYQRDVGPAALRRILSVLRKALNDAVRDRMIPFNPAAQGRVYMERDKPRKALIWTPPRKEAFFAAYRARLEEAPGARGDRAFTTWRSMSLRPSPVMVWTTEDLGAFLDHAASHRLGPIYEVIAGTAMRRGEICGLHWTDVNLEGAQLRVGAARVQVGWQVEQVTPKTEAGWRDITLDAGVVKALRAWRKRQMQERLAWGSDWVENGLVFTRDNGAPLHPDTVTDTFERLALAAGLPPVNVHALRHGWATYARRAGIDIKVVQERLGHSSSELTLKTYSSIADELAQQAADTVAAMIPRKARRQ